MSIGAAFGTSSVVWNPDLGEFISEEHRRVAEIIHDFNPYFSLVFIPKNQRTTEQERAKPFAILQSGVPNMRDTIIRHLSEEEMRDSSSVLAWLFEGDQRRHRSGDILRKIEAKDAAERALAMKREMDQREDEMQFAEYVFSDKSPNTFKHNGQVYRK